MREDFHFHQQMQFTIPDAIFCKLCNILVTYYTLMPFSDQLLPKCYNLEWQQPKKIELVKLENEEIYKYLVEHEHQLRSSLISPRRVCLKHFLMNNTGNVLFHFWPIMVE